MSWRNAKDWWKAPILQGPENDYGDYDYLATELPEDCAKWEFSKEKWKCETCGKYHHLNLNSAHYFYCWDGWDSMDYTECWRCYMGSKVHSKIYKVKRKIKALFKTYNLCKDHKSFKHFKVYYDIFSKN